MIRFGILIGTIKIKAVFERLPRLFRLIQIIRHRRYPSTMLKIISRRTIVVIEGYPRSANSFCVRAFRSTNDPDRRKKIATHLHSYAQLRLAKEWNIPALVLIRDPDQAVISAVALQIQTARFTTTWANRHKSGLVRLYTSEYIRFYTKLRSQLSSFVIGEFSETTTRFDLAIDRLNRRFGTDFSLFPHNPTNVKAIFETSKIRLSPSVERDRLKAELANVYFSTPNEKLRRRARATYRWFLEHSPD